MDDQQLLRYSRHILLEAIGIEGQQAIHDAHAVIIGAGGLGSPAAMYLASAGTGTITLVDHDHVDLTNLQRQIMHSSESVGQAKVQSGKQTLHRINPDIKIHTIQEKADQERLYQLISGATVVLDCSDNFATRHAVNRACVAHKVPLVSGAAIGFDGQISVYDTRREDAPCYACVFPPDAEFEEVLCSRMGVFAPLVGMIGTMQAAEALKLMMGLGKSLAGRLLMLDSISMDWTRITTKRNPECPVCKQRHSAAPQQ